jgi:hypothetical protein
MNIHSNIKLFICKNPNSKFKGLLHDDIILGLRKIGFCFYKDSENTFWPIFSSRFELINEGFVEVPLALVEG